MINLLIDTNILIYALNQNSIYHSESKQILTNNQHNLFITSKNISEYFAVCSKLKISIEFSLGFFDEIKENTNVIYPSTESLKHFQKLLIKYNPIGNRVYDIEIVSIMLSHKINKIATFNIKDFEQIEEIENLIKGF